MDRPTLEVADVFRRYGDAYRQQAGGSLSTAQRRVMTAIETCRTAVLGGHVEQCDACGHQRIAYNSCANRHCPTCQSLARAAWIDRRRAEILDCEYFHVVFTVPDAIAAIAGQNKAQVDGILFRATAETLRTIAADPQHLGAEIGFFAVLHTWGQTLVHHPHLHCVVPGGGLSPDGTRWVACRPGFLLPVRVLSRLFRRLFLQDLQAAYDAGTLRLMGPLEALRDRPAWTCALAAVRQTEWVVYAKRPFAGPQQVVDYVGRYTHRVALSNNRLLDMDAGQVRFTYKDYRADPPDSPKTMTLAAAEFIRRFLLHVLPAGFHRIRYYGFLGPRHRREKLIRCRQLLASTASITTLTDATSRMDYRDRVETLTGISLRLCPACHHGQMIVIERIVPARLPGLIPDTS
jgi:Putative transposase/Transposase zinc-binding domain